jgi:hypothetical protein
MRIGDANLNRLKAVMGGSCRVPSYDARCVHRCTRHESYGLGFAGTLLKRLPDLLYLLHHSIQLIHKSLVMSQG